MCSQNLQAQLETLAKKGATALERFEAYTAEPSRAVFDFAQVKRAINGMSAVSNQVAFLREQIEMRSLGLGWSDLHTPISAGKDESQDELAVRLLAHLKAVLREETVRFKSGFKVPADAPMPDFERKSAKQLGTPTADSLELARRAMCSPEQVRAASERERERREAAGFTDGVQRVMPREAPPLDNTLVETQLEVCWGTYKSTVDGTNVKMWCPCVVKRVADGETDKGRDGQYFSARAKKLAPRGMVLVEWEPDPDRGETEATLMWLLLDPRAERSGGKWNGDSHRAWRFHPAELKKRAEQREAPESPDKHMR